MSTDLVSWLRSQLDADEEVATVPAGVPVAGWYAAADIDFAGRWARGGVPDFDAAFIAANSPAHVLRTVAAHRAILNRHSPRKVLNFDGVRAIGMECSACFEPGGRCDSWEQHTPMDFPCPDVRALASIYAGRDGFDPSWRADP